MRCLLYLTFLNIRYSKYLMFLFSERNTGGNHPITLQKYDILIIYTECIKKKVDKSEIAFYFMKRFNARTFLLK